MTAFYQVSPKTQLRRLRNLAYRALTKYGLNVSKIRLLGSDFNTVYQVVADGERYILRVCRPDSGHGPEELRSEALWLKALNHDSDLLVPKPIMNLADEVVTTVSAPGVPEPCHVVVFSYVPGIDLARRLTSDTVEQVGVLLATLHEHTATWMPPPEFRVRSLNRIFIYDDPSFEYQEPSLFAALPDALELGDRQKELFTEALAEVQAVLDQLYEGSEAARVIHNDVHQYNVKVYRRCLGLTDFEDLMWGYPIQDLATTIFYLYSYPEFPAWLRALKQGYAAVRPVPFHELEELEPYFLARAFLIGNFMLSTKEEAYRKAAPSILARLEGKVKQFLRR